MTDLLQTLNDAQREAVTATEGVVRVLAGAGSGKTRALSHRFAWLVNEAGLLPENLLCVTFTNKSANEMRQRIHLLTGDNDTGYICTFHSFCVSVLQEDSHAVQYPKRFLVLDNSDIDAMLQIIYEERGLTLRDMTFGDARDMIEVEKLFRRPDYYKDMIAMPLETLHAKYREAVSTRDIVFYGYLYQEKKCFGLDYNDLIKFTLYIFQEHAEIRQKWQQRLEYIMIDEFQDIDSLQYELMRVLCGYHGNLFVVGDPDQTIYTWRGADGRYLMELDRRFSGVKTVMMMQNYRSTPQILRAVNSLIEKNQNRIPKELIPTLPEGERPRFYFGENSEGESRWIAGEIQRLRGAGERCGDMAILYRAHYVTRTVEEALRREQIPYTIYSGASFFDRREVKDALSYLRMIAYQDDLAFLRVANVPRRNLGQKRMAYLREYAAAHACTLYTALKENLESEPLRGTKARGFAELVERFSASYHGKPVSEVLSAVVNESGLEKMLRTEGSQERLDNLAELKQSVYEYEVSCGEECTLEDYLAHVALFTNADTAEQGDKVKLMTVHAAKGLEFPTVFLCGMDEGIFPSRKVKTLPGMEEERRLAFVAMTRAERRLILTGSGGRNHDGSPRFPSRFVLDIDPALLDYVLPPEEGLIHTARSYIESSSRALKSGEEESLLPAGQRVNHAMFGTGTILEADEKRGSYLVKFDRLDTPRRLSVRAKLEAL